MKSRRNFLRSTAGVTLGLPWLASLAPKASASSDLKLDAPPVRTAFLFMPNGVHPDHWSPEITDDPKRYKMSPMLRSLESVRDEIVLLENLHHPNLNDRNGHWCKVPAFLSGGHVLRTSGRDMDTEYISCDQLMASKIGLNTPLPSFELAVDSAYTGVDVIGGGFTRIYGSHIAWRDRHTPVPNEVVPQLAFDRLFRGGQASTPVSGLNLNDPAVTKSLQGDQQRLLDSVMDDAKTMARRLGSEDRHKLGEYFESVRSVERRIEATMKPQRRWINEGRMGVGRPKAGIPEQHVDHVRLMLDIMVLAFWTDTTRVATFMFGNAQTGRNFSFLEGVSGSYHEISHHQDNPKTMKQYEKIGTWHVEQFAYLVDRMRSLKEGDGTLLDHSQVMFGSSLRDGNKHADENLPLVLAGKANGAIKTGTRIIAPENSRLCNLYVSMLNNMGIDVDSFGTSNGKLQLS